MSKEAVLADEIHRLLDKHGIFVTDWHAEKITELLQGIDEEEEIEELSLKEDA